MLLLAAVCFWGPYEPASNHNSVQQMPYTVGRGDDDDIGRPATRASVVLPVQMQGFLKDCNFRQIVNHRSAGNPANIAPAVCPVPSGAKAQHGKSYYNEYDGKRTKADAEALRCLYARRTGDYQVGARR